MSDRQTDRQETWHLWWFCCWLFLSRFKAIANSSAPVFHSFFSALQDIGPIGPDRNWKGIGISLLVILVVLSLIGLSIVLLSKGKRCSKSRLETPIGSSALHQFVSFQPELLSCLVIVVNPLLWRPEKKMLIRLRCLMWSNHRLLLFPSLFKPRQWLWRYSSGYKIRNFCIVQKRK